MAQAKSKSLCESEINALMQVIQAKTAYMISRAIFRDRKKHQRTRINELQNFLVSTSDEERAKKLQCAIKSKRKVYNRMAQPQQHLQRLNLSFVRVKSELIHHPLALSVFQSINKATTN
nr:hypothetical protein [Vibrio splendidus]MCC4880444.1 hypothetical protein [Vibrio splendidus]